MAATGQFRTATNATTSIDRLERAIAAGKNDSQTWAAYAEALQRQHSFAHAAGAYERALELQPAYEALQPLRLNAALCLAQAGDAGKFFSFFGRMTTTDPKLAVNLLDRAEVERMRSDARWSAAAATARSQAAD